METDEGPLISSLLVQIIRIGVSKVARPLKPDLTSTRDV
jgi:hypothetical protein